MTLKSKVVSRRCPYCLANLNVQEDFNDQEVTEETCDLHGSICSHCHGVMVIENGVARLPEDDEVDAINEHLEGHPREQEQHERFRPPDPSCPECLGTGTVFATSIACGCGRPVQP